MTHLLSHLKQWLFYFGPLHQVGLFLLSCVVVDRVFEVQWTTHFVSQVLCVGILFLALGNVVRARRPREQEKRTPLSLEDLDALLGKLRAAVEKDKVTSHGDVHVTRKQVSFGSVVFLPLSGNKAFVLPDPYQEDVVSKALDAERTSRFLTENGYAHQTLQPLNRAFVSGGAKPTQWPTTPSSLVMEFPASVFNFN